MLWIIPDPWFRGMFCKIGKTLCIVEEFWEAALPNYKWFSAVVLEVAFKSCGLSGEWAQGICGITLSWLQQINVAFFNFPVPLEMFSWPFKEVLR